MCCYCGTKTGGGIYLPGSWIQVTVTQLEKRKVRPADGGSKDETLDQCTRLLLYLPLSTEIVFQTVCLKEHCTCNSKI